MSINELFGTNSNEVSVGSRALNGTAELTSVASKVANEIIRKMEDDIDSYRERIAKSATDSKEMDALLDEFKPWCDIEEDDLLNNLADETVESMLKSQQSKRSRLKGKAMTLDNYQSLMTASIAENLLRALYNKPKSATAGSRSSYVGYTPARLEELAADQESLSKEIRNIQSKKSIMKAKAEFSEGDERYLQLLKDEQMLKDLRVGGRKTHIVEVDTTKDKLLELLGNVDPEHLKAADSKELLSSIKAMLEAEDDMEAESDDEQ